MRFKILEVRGGARTRGGRYVEYNIDAELDTGRNVTLFWSTSRYGDELKGHIGQFVNGVVEIFAYKIFPYDECPKNGLDKALHAKGTLKNIDPMNFVNDPSMNKFKDSLLSPSKIDIGGKGLETFGTSFVAGSRVLDTADGMFLCGIKPEDREKFTDGDKICCYGKIYLLCWSPVG